MVFSSKYALLLIGEILMGVGVVADLSISLATISEQVPDDKRAKISRVFSSSCYSAHPQSHMRLPSCCTASMLRSPSRIS